LSLLAHCLIASLQIDWSPHCCTNDMTTAAMIGRSHADWGVPEDQRIAIPLERNICAEVVLLLLVGPKKNFKWGTDQKLCKTSEQQALQRNVFYQCFFFLSSFSTI
jgi:hypothetical protein